MALGTKNKGADFCDYGTLLFDPFDPQIYYGVPVGSTFCNPRFSIGSQCTDFFGLLLKLYIHSPVETGTIFLPPYLILVTSAIGL